MNYFEYGDTEISYLKTKDKRLGEAIDRIGFLERKVDPDLFSALIHQILSQQISTKGALTVWARMMDKLGAATPHNIYNADADVLQQCGTSMRKVSYMKELSEQVMDGSLDLSSLYDMDDEQICQHLTSIKGIGVWTAEMLMTFSMQRKNIISFDDIAIQRGLRMLYRHRTITRSLFDKYKRRYSPYASVASLYLWAIASGEYEEFTDPAPKAQGRKKTVKNPV